MSRTELKNEIERIVKEKRQLDVDARQALECCDSYKFQMLQIQRGKLEADLFDLEQQLKQMEGVKNYEK